jgi:hypothetical protein
MNPMGLKTKKSINTEEKEELLWYTQTDMTNTDEYEMVIMRMM